MPESETYVDMVADGQKMGYFTVHQSEWMRNNKPFILTFVFEDRYCSRTDIDLVAALACYEERPEVLHEALARPQPARPKEEFLLW